ncbi:hypothetical protein AMS68_007932 [Peltaster fructicola]|uniref:Mso1 N-terminal domain-containing protein n=1 Tax=Peltaster fructicola TaxID=286661 RepID=A0A6H0Y686_9PEZI|nr:hypothetical protein AMS68_007932 [Peltaster fructicola]
MASYTSYLSNILTHTTSRYNSLRKILLNNEDDGDTEDDSHISRVLRAYYTEKGRSFPPWLPPDPNDRRAKTPQQPVQQGTGYFGTALGARNPYGNAQQAPNRGNGSLNDLWDAPAAAAPAPVQPQSLRAGRRMPGGGRPEPAANSLSVPQARPLPSQRAGSYQTLQPPQQSGFSMDPNPSPGGTAQDRLKARLWGRGGSSTSVSSNAQEYDPYANPPPSDPYGNASGGGNARRQGRFG